MQDNQNQRKGKFSLSIVLSFLVAVFAIFSLVVVGFNQISYAAPSGTTTGSFTMVHDGEKVVYGYASSARTGGGFVVPMYYTNANNPVFCVEHNRGVTDGAEYSPGAEIDDYGLLYILDNSLVNGKKMLNENSCGAAGTSSCSNDKTETWATQVAIWVYLSKKYPSAAEHAITADEMAIIESTKYLYYPASGSLIDDGMTFSQNVYSHFIEPIVTKALSMSAEKKLTVDFVDDDVVKVDGTDYHQTPQLVITGYPTEDLKTFDITVSGIDGVFAVDENGTKIDSLNGISASKKIYFRIPSAQVTKTAKTLTAKVVGHFDSLKGNYFTSTGSLQKVVTVTGSSVDVTKSDDIEVVGSEDTGMNKAQTIYFIGLIVLLCGVGIVYANAKPVESK